MIDMIYAVICQLKKWWKDYSSLYQKIESYGTWMHYIDNVWIIESTKDAQQISNDLLPFIDQEKDFILVIQIAKNYQGWLPKEAWNWMNERNFY